MAKAELVGERGSRPAGAVPEGKLVRRKPRPKEVIAAKVKALRPAAVRTLADTMPEGVAPVGNGYFLLAAMQKLDRARKKGVERKLKERK